MKLPERAQYVLTGMVFQLGVTKVQKFVKFLTALSKNDYNSAANEMCNSAWYKQTPNRVKKLSEDIRSLAG
jgi:predicted unusual protein kinase regulating ubiquinone biosynthesis (AarF/ABC1/UbiB family)